MLGAQEGLVALAVGRDILCFRSAGKEHEKASPERRHLRSEAGRAAVSRRSRTLQCDNDNSARAGCPDRRKVNLLWREALGGPAMRSPCHRCRARLTVDVVVGHKLSECVKVSAEKGQADTPDIA